MQCFPKAESLASYSPGHRPGFLHTYTYVLKGQNQTTMSQSLNKIYTHIIFSTKNREDILPLTNLDNIHRYIEGIINRNLCKSIIVGGTANHIHILCELASTVSIAMLLQEIKRSSSKWIKNEYPKLQYFAWQNGYAAFSVSQSKVAAVTHYICKQQEHHQKKSFREELIDFLKSYHVEYNEEYLWT
ncbi:hypothetical protein HMPREF9447_01553 [Bacteroides oleiciplenus YIT 12058]|uniref:Transposase IS200-like domain-containing protein n=2 Tax=Bacteroides oleiciplenus TaxID=626931 RepID=K9E3X7_9BACE|nr:hypothetical protein HMPREF9447_01553 [Bacteroides oleiciplenus YIT 12058]